MSNDPAFTETELAQRWAISIKTLQRWRSENRGPRYIKLSKVVRYRLADILDHEQAQRQDEPVRNELPPLPNSAPAVSGMRGRAVRAPCANPPSIRRDQRFVRVAPRTRGSDHGTRECNAFALT